VRISVRALAPGETDHELLWSAVGLAALGAGLAVGAVGPAFDLPCVFKAVTGWPCVTCGATRAVRLLAAGQAGAAARMNPLVTTGLLAWAAFVPYGLGVTAGWWPRVRMSAAARDCTALRIAAVAAVLATWLFLVVDGR
jgi:hypothetical protein